MDTSPSHFVPDVPDLSPIIDAEVSPIADNYISPLIEQHGVGPRGVKRRRELFPTFPRKPEGELKGPGKIPLYKKHPKIVTTVNDSLLDHGFGAHRRRSETWASVGVSAEKLCKEIVKEVDELQSISVSSVRRLFVPPSKSRKASSRYSSVIDAKIGTKHNDLSSENVDSHYCRTSVRYALEMGTCFRDEVCMISADDKNKLLIGGNTPCVNRHQKFHTYFMNGDECHTADHNFSNGYKVIASGYMPLELKPGTSHFKVDHRGCARFRFPRTGPLHITLRGNKFFRATVYNHYDDLFPMLQSAKENGKHSCVIVCDNGPDWRKNSLKLLVVIGRLWRDLDLDYICLVSYCAGDSRFNMIEHAWAPTTSWLTGLCLNDKVPGESNPPDKQSNLTRDECREKEVIVLDNAIADVHRCLQDREYDGFPVFSREIKCESQHVYDDEEEINELSKAHLTIIEADDDLLEKAEEFQFLQRHSVQRRYVIEFIKCQQPDCNHCISNPQQSQKLMTFLNHTGGCVFPPVRDPQDPDHFMPWPELAAEVFDGHRQVPELDEGLSASYDGDITKCPMENCRKVYQSHADGGGALT